ncbi:MAG: hypothetical protein BWX96_03099 [Bacteroidetes bacterium ADurb.Bin145]|nr:MAG: hypothetical protein BWX96_03099 [Bacteroidetes bacterium ADurb.Bin145]
MIILNTNEIQKYVKTITANFVTSGLSDSDTFKSLDQSINWLAIMKATHTNVNIMPRMAYVVLT